MKKIKMMNITLLMMMFSFTILHASEPAAPVLQASEPAVPIIGDMVKRLKIEDAITQAQKKNKKLRMQETNIELAEVNTEGAKEHYYNSWDFGFEKASADYAKAIANEEYERKNEDVIAEQLAYNINNQFDSILELEQKQRLVNENIKIQRQKVAHAIKKEQLGLGSQSSIKAERTKLEVQKKEIESLIQTIDVGYRKLNDAIDGKEERYHLIKENIYEPLNMERSLKGQISYAIDSDLGLWLQEEMAKTDEKTFTAPGYDGYAPTYAVYQQRKLGYEKALNNVALSKEGKEEQIKQIYENILALEIQHAKLLVDLEETQRQYGIMKKRYELGMITSLNLEELKLAILQNQVQITSVTTQHNQLKILFEKSYLGVSQM